MAFRYFFFQTFKGLSQDLQGLFGKKKTKEQGYKISKAKGNAKTKDGGGDGDGRETEDLIVIINGVAVTKTFVVESE